MRRFFATVLASWLSIFLSLPVFSSAQPTGDVASAISSQYARSTVFLAIQGVSKKGEQENKTGTGFVISDQGYVLTAGHLFLDSDREPYAKLVIRGSLGISFDVQSPTGVIF